MDNKDLPEFIEELQYSLRDLIPDKAPYSYIEGYNDGVDMAQQAIIKHLRKEGILQMFCGHEWKDDKCTKCGRTKYGNF